MKVGGKKVKPAPKSKTGQAGRVTTGMTAWDGKKQGPSSKGKGFGAC